MQKTIIRSQLLIAFLLIIYVIGQPIVEEAVP